MNLTKNFKLIDFTRSQTATRQAIDNTPDGDVVGNLTRLCQNILQPLRDHTGFPIIVTSGFRCPLLNVRIGGSKTSQHVFGEAADIMSTEYDERELFDLIRTSPLEFDQLIYEGNWVHVSHSNKKPNRREVMVAHFKGGKATYSQAEWTPGITWDSLVPVGRPTGNS